MAYMWPIPHNNIKQNDHIVGHAYPHPPPPQEGLSYNKKAIRDVHI